MTKWQYTIMEALHPGVEWAWQEDLKRLDMAGEEGWELVSIIGDGPNGLFKRPVNSGCVCCFSVGDDD